MVSIFKRSEKKRRTKLIKSILEKRRFPVLRETFQKNIENFEHFKNVQDKKKRYLLHITKVWDRKWKEGELFLREDIPKLVYQQVRFMNDFLINARNESSFIFSIDISLTDEEKGLFGHLTTTEEVKRYMSEQSRILCLRIERLINFLRSEWNTLRETHAWEIVSNPENKLYLFTKEEDKIIAEIGSLIKAMVAEIKGFIEKEKKRIAEEQARMRAQEEFIASERSKYHDLQQKFEEQRGLLLAKQLKDDSVEQRKLRIITEIYEGYLGQAKGASMIKREVFVWYLQVIYQMNLEVMKLLGAPITYEVKAENSRSLMFRARQKGMQPAQLIDLEIKELDEVLRNQNEYIEKLIKDIKSGRFYYKHFYFKLFVPKDRKMRPEDLPWKHNFSLNFFTLMNVILTEFSVCKHNLYPFLANKLAIKDLYSNRKLPYWSTSNLAAESGKLSLYAEQNLSSRDDFILEEEIFMDDSQLRSLSDNRRKRILKVIKKVNKLFELEMKNRPVGGNILFHSSNFLNLQSMVKDGGISTKDEKKYLEGEKIRGHEAGGSVGISFDFNVGAHFTYCLSGVEAGGIFMLPLIKALRIGYILTSTFSLEDKFEIVLVHERIGKAQKVLRNYSYINPISTSLIDAYRLLSMFYNDEEDIKKNFFKKCEKMGIVDFVLELFFNSYAIETTVGRDNADKIKNFFEGLNQDHDIYSLGDIYHESYCELERHTILPSEVIKLGIEKCKRYTEEAKSESRNAFERLSNEIRKELDNKGSIFYGLYQKFLNEFQRLKEYYKMPFGKFFLLHSELYKYKDSISGINPKKEDYSWLFCNYAKYINEIGVSKQMGVGRLSSIGSVIPKPLDIGHTRDIYEFFDKCETYELLPYLVAYILKVFYNGREFESLNVKEVGEIIEKRVPEFIIHIRYRAIGFLETKVFLKDCVLLLPKTKFDFWEGFFRKSGNRPCVAFYFDDKPRQSKTSIEDRTKVTYRIEPLVELHILGRLSSTVIPKFLRRCGIDFKPMFTTDGEYKPWIRGKYLIGNVYERVTGECTHYEVMEYKKE